jgi:hypothetical protein
MAGASANPYRCAYGVLGSTNNNGSISLSYGHTTRFVSIPVVGDPRLQ